MWAFSHAILSVIEHLRLVVPLVDDLVSEGASSRVVSIVSIVDFMHYLSSILQTETSQVWIGVEAGVELLV